MTTPVRNRRENRPPMASGERGNLLTFFRAHDIRYEGIPPQPPHLPSITAEDLAGLAAALLEPSVEPVLEFGDAVLFRGSSGQVYFRDLGVVHRLGTGSADVAAYFTGRKPWGKAVYKYYSS